MNDVVDKLSNIIKALLLIVAIILTYVLFIISDNLENGRYQMDNNNGYNKIVFDTKTGELYYINNDGDYIKDKNGKEIIIKNLPK